MTVDGHMVSAWAGKRIKMKDVAVYRFKYSRVVDDVKKLALENSLIPCQVQAIIWLTWKRINGIVYNANLDLFGDHWHYDLVPAGIRGY